MATLRYTRQFASFLTKRPHVARCHFSTQSSELSSSGPRVITADPGDFVQGGTRERFENDPEFADFMMANFPEHFDPTYDPNAKSDVEQLPDFLWSQEKHPKKPRQKLSNAERDALDNAPLNMRPLKAYLRDPTTERKKYANKQMRNQDAHMRYIPGVLKTNARADTLDLPNFWNPYWSKRQLLVKTPWSPLQREFDRYLDRVDNGRVYNLSIYEKTPPPPPRWYKEEEMEEHKARLAKHYDNQEPIWQGHVVPKDILWHPINTIDCFNINYVPFRPGKTVLRLGLEFVNQEESPALKSDSCFTINVARRIPVVIEEGVPIPEHIAADCAGLNVKDVIRRDRLILPDGVRLAPQVMNREYKNYVVGVVMGSRRYLLAERGGEE